MKGFLLILSVAVCSLTNAQPLKLFLGGGVANYSGDIQQKRFTFSQARQVFSVGATYDLSDRIALRTDFSFAGVGADDKLIGNPDTETRNLNFKTNIAEWNLLGEFNILNISNTGWSPYLFGGVGVFSFNPYTTDPMGNKVFLAPLKTEGQGLAQFPDRKPYKTIQLNIPAGVGIKFAIAEDVHLAAELGVRKLFTDYLDDVSTNYVDKDVLLNAYGPRTVEYAFRGDELLHNPYDYPQQGAQRGSPKYKDFYYFAQLRVGFRLNWFDASGGSARGVGCPSRIW